MSALRHLGAALAAALLVAFAAEAAEVGALVADRIDVDPAGRITASGNVEVIFEGARLTAAEVAYDRDGDRLTIRGPIRVTDADGTVLIADAAELDRDLRNGILRSARMVLDDQLQIAADEIARVDARYTRLDRVVASSCEVCAANPVPIWEIRAARVTHDDIERQLYFEDAQIRLGGIPVFYLPRLRLPDPSVDRATGLLIPQIGTSSDLGTGIKLPYFIALGDHADVTLTPYLSARTRTLEYRFRQVFPKGQVQATGALTSDDLEGARGFIFADAEYALPADFTARAQVEFVSDPGYLFLYGYADKDRLSSAVEVTRFRDADGFRVGVTDFRTLRDSEITIRDTLPDQFAEIAYSREIPALGFGGRLVASADATSLLRPGTADIDGRDVTRIGAALDWSRDWLFGPGMLGRAELGIRADAYTIAQDSTFGTELTRVIPRAAAELRWPLARDTADGGREVLEPVLRLDASDTGGGRVPVEDSRVVEFDEANLFSPTRYPGVDGAENGLRVAAGVAWRREDPQGWQADLAFGRVANLTGDLGYAEGSGLAGDRSEWLIAGRLAFGDRLSLLTRSLFDASARFTLSETRVDWQEDRFGIGTSYLFAEPEPAEDRTSRLAEWSFEGRYEINGQWTALADWRYDFTANRAARAGLGLGFHTECFDLSLSLSRRYATSTSVDPTTDFGFRVSLTGVGGREADRQARRSCRG